jgi:predicted amidohydrolase YtcJ
MKRRDFFMQTASAAAGLASGTILPGAAAQSLPSPPGRSSGGTLALVNARIVTLDERKPTAEAVLVRGGRIVAVGSTAEVRAQAVGAPEFDAAGRTVVPGFVDAHVHLEMAAIAAEWQVPAHTPPHKNLRSIFDAMRGRIAKTDPGRWVIARGSYSLAEDVDEGRMPTRLELDALSDRHPIMVFAGLHVVSLNSQAFKKLGLWDLATEKSLTWRNGRPRVGTIVHRDAAGMPTGIATEIADLLYAAEAYSVDEVKDAIKKRARPLFVEKGITSVATIPSSGSNIVADQELRAAGELPLRVRFYPRIPMTTSIESLIEMGWRPGFGDDMLRFGGIKIFVDGTGSDGLGVRVEDLKWTAPELNDVMVKAQKSGLQALLHIVTRGGLQMALNAIEEALKHDARPLRHRFEHVGFLTEADIRRIKRLGVGVAVTRATRGGGQPRSMLRTCLDHGVEPIATSDSTGTVPQFTALAGIASLMAPPAHGGVLPEGAAFSFEEALRSWTLWAARSIFEEQDKGSISTGKVGDFAVLSADPRERRGAELFDIGVDATILGGNPVFQK